MKKFIIALLALSVIGCSTTAEKYNLTQEDKYSELKELEPFNYNEELPKRPSVVPLEVEGMYYAGISNEGLAQMLAYKNKSERNAEVLDALMETHAKTVRQYNDLLLAAKYEEDEANAYKFMYSEKQDELESEQNKSSLEKLLYQLGLGALVVLTLF